jgi:peroxiredoxin (alkyl hydroperoxide reductase subunit C)
MRMSDATSMRLGQTVPDFELDTYEPTKGDFGKFRLQDQLKNGRWTVLFFYPADFTFV